jgi:surfeit locus 1 family protein
MIFRPWLTLAVLPALAVLIALGVWQLERREWKHALIARIDEQVAGGPRDLVEILTGPAEDRPYAHVEADGTIDPAKAVHLFSPTAEGASYRVIAPLDYGEGRFVLVDLGTITEAEKAALTTPLPQAAAGRVHAEGILRPSDPPGWFDAAPDGKANRWYARDVPAMAAALGVPQAPPFILQSQTPNAGGLPRPVPFRPDLPDNHLAYAVTWFSFALTLLVIFGLMSRRPGARPA